MRPPPEGHHAELIKAWTRSPFARMAEINRYSSWPVHHKESVAEHCYFVGLFALVICNDLTRTGQPVNVAKVMTDALVHDLDESLTGDFIRTFKYSDSRIGPMLEEATRAGMREQLREMPCGGEIFHAWETAKDGSLEGQIVSIADLWSVVFYARREIAIGNAYAVAVLQEVAGWLNRTEWHDLLAPYASVLRNIATFGAASPASIRAEAESDLTDPYWKEFNKTEGE